MHFSHIYFRSSTQQRGPRKLVFNKYWWIHSNPNPNSSLFILVISLSFCFLESWGSSASKIMNPNGCIICHCVEHVALVDRCSYTTEVRTFIQQPLMSINPISQFPAEWHVHVTQEMRNSNDFSIFVKITSSTFSFPLKRC